MVEQYYHLTGEFRGNGVRCTAHVYLDRSPWDQKHVIGECVTVKGRIQPGLSYGYFPVHDHSRDAESSGCNEYSTSEYQADVPESDVDSVYQNRHPRNYYYSFGTSQTDNTESEAADVAQPTSWEQYSEWESDRFYRRKRFNYYTDQWEYE
ncbi:hypothetical protein F5Y12DRAFT_716310 [Xylaria sp. FL1777]|nr:hypothetical protein F5Y12DRAFT_716310 [Xylaria sp. FL1777]